MGCPLFSARNRYKHQMSQKPAGMEAKIPAANGSIIGTVVYCREHMPNHLETGIVIYWSGGLGSEALSLWIEHLFASMDIVGIPKWSGNERRMKCAAVLSGKICFPEKGLGVVVTVLFA